MVVFFQKYERLQTLSETDTHSLHSYCPRINLFGRFLSHFQCSSSLKIYILVWVVKSMIYWSLEVNYYFLSQSNFFCTVNYVYSILFNILLFSKCQIWFNSDIIISNITNTFKDPLTQNLQNVILFGQTQEFIVQYHVRTPRRYDDNCSVFTKQDWKIR